MGAGPPVPRRLRPGPRAGRPGVPGRLGLGRATRLGRAVRHHGDRHRSGAAGRARRGGPRRRSLRRGGRPARQGPVRSGLPPAAVPPSRLRHQPDIRDLLCRHPAGADAAARLREGHLRRGGAGAGAGRRRRRAPGGRAAPARGAIGTRCCRPGPTWRAITPMPGASRNWPRSPHRARRPGERGEDPVRDEAPGQRGQHARGRQLHAGRAEVWSLGRHLRHAHLVCAGAAILQGHLELRPGRLCVRVGALPHRSHAGSGHPRQVPEAAPAHPRHGRNVQSGGRRRRLRLQPSRRGRARPVDRVPRRAERPGHADHASRARSIRGPAP